MADPLESITAEMAKLRTEAIAGQMAKGSKISVTEFRDRLFQNMDGRQRLLIAMRIGRHQNDLEAMIKSLLHWPEEL
jgi:hypothetical protein